MLLYFLGDKMKPIIIFTIAMTLVLWLICPFVYGVAEGDPWDNDKPADSDIYPTSMLSIRNNNDALEAVLGVDLADVRNVNQFDDFEDAISTISTTATRLIISDTQTVAANTTVPSTLSLQIIQGGSLEPASGIVVTVQGALFAGAYTIFGGDGSVDMTAALVTSVLPEWWGAVSDNDATAKTVTTAGIQRAVNGGLTQTAADALGDNFNSPPVEFQEGIYIVEEGVDSTVATPFAIKLAHQTEIIGAGRRKSKIELDDSALLASILYHKNATLLAEYISIRDIRLEGNYADPGPFEFSGTATGGTSATVMTDSGQSWTVDGLIGLIIHNMTDIESSGQHSFGTITDNDATSITVSSLAGGSDDQWEAGDVYVIDGGGDGIHLFNVTHIWIKNVDIRFNQNNGVYLYRPHFAHIRDFQITEASQNGIKLASGDGINFTNVHIDGQNVMSQIAWDSDGSILGDFGASIYIEDGGEITVRGVSNENSRTFIYVEGNAITNIQVENNFTENLRHASLHSDYSNGNISQLIFQNNKFGGRGGVRQYIKEPLNEASVKQVLNTAIGDASSGTGIVILQNSGGWEQNTGPFYYQGQGDMRTKHLDDAIAPVLSFNLPNLIVAGAGTFGNASFVVGINGFKRGDASTNTVGIYTVSLAFSTAAKMEAKLDRIDYGDNELIGSETWNPDNVADGEMVSNDVTVTGAVLGDFAVASFSLDVEDLVLNANVTSSGTVTVTLTNDGIDAGVNLGEGTLRVKAIGFAPELSGDAAAWVNATIDAVYEVSTDDTSSSNATIMTDSGASFTADRLVGMIIFNTTDGSQGLITDNGVTTVTVAELHGGTENDWDSGDAYQIAGAQLNVTNGSFAPDRGIAGNVWWMGSGHFLATTKFPLTILPVEDTVN